MSNYINNLQGRRVAFLATDGFEQVELTRPWEAMQSAGAEVELVSLEPDEIQGMHHDQFGDKFSVDQRVDAASAGDYDALVLPGGVQNPDSLRMNGAAVSFVREFVEAGKPVAAICHGAWTLVEADVVRGRTLTSWPSLQTDIRNAGGKWVDREVVIDDCLITSRRPDDLDAFCKAAVEVIAKQAQSQQTG